jgi:hypothetical protein
MKTATALLLLLLSAAPGTQAQSQSFYCSNEAEIAERMIRDMTTTDIRPEHYVTAEERNLAVDAIHCAERGENVKACVQRRCMEEAS